jgi:cation:H+ antiporter
MARKFTSHFVLWLMVLSSLQWVLFHLIVAPSPSPLGALFSGLAIFSAAFLLTWAAEIVQFDIPQSVALILVALLAVLPEYAVDVYFAWMAGKDPTYISYAAANMTGANRLLIGIGWAAVFVTVFLRERHRKIDIPVAQRLELRFLLLATAYSFVIPFFRQISLFDCAVFLAIFVLYVRRAIKEHVVEPELGGGPTEILGALAPWARRLAALSLFALAGLTIYHASHPFAEGLLAIGEQWGIEKFILVQWVAPLASESPEFLVAILFAWNYKPGAGLGALISSKVNQWTLLIGMLPLVYSLSAGHFMPMPMDARQNEEILLTAAQSLFALVLIADLEFHWYDALLLAVPFLAQAFFPSMEIRVDFAIGYIVLSALFLLRRSTRQGLRALLPLR